MATRAVQSVDAGRGIAYLGPLKYSDAPTSKTINVGAYAEEHQKFLDPNVRIRTYYFSIGREGGFSKVMVPDLFSSMSNEVREFTLVSLKRAPQRWHEGLHRQLMGESSPFSMIGYITYFITNNVASTVNYYPRAALRYDVARGIPYFFEAMSTKDLKDRGIRKIRTSHVPSIHREDQLRAVDLRVEKVRNIDEWLRSMGRGIWLRTQGSDGRV